MNNTEIKIERRNKIVEGLKIAYKRLIEEKRKNNRMIVISRNGEIIEIKP
ncbi:MAG: hypothetical protein MH137_10100 [Flavobacteriales bacterium]|nr:hypothetical protein [Flavobacteriales bacterium]